MPKIINKIYKSSSNYKKEFSFNDEIISRDGNLINILINIEDSENKISKIIYPDNTELICNNKEHVAIDYKVEYNKDYVFKIIDGNNETHIQTIIEKKLFDSNGLIPMIEDINISETDVLVIDGTYSKEEYAANIIVHNGDLILDGSTQVAGATLNNKIYEFGNKNKDVGTEDNDASNMVILKVIGNLTINENVTLTSCKSDLGYGGPKGMLIYCTGTITNNGTISMTARGAKASGQYVYLYENQNGSFEYIPKDGGTGGLSVTVGKNSSLPGIAGSDGEKRSTGGGGSGQANRSDASNGPKLSTSGAGAQGTSYSGGPGGGSIDENAVSHSYARNGSPNGRSWRCWCWNKRYIILGI